MPALSHYYKLNSKICDVMESVLDKCLTPATENIMNLMEIENATINTNHPDFVGSADSLLNLFQDEQNSGPGMVKSGRVADESGQPVNKTYSIMKKERREKGQQDLQDFNNIEETKQNTDLHSSQAPRDQSEQVMMNSNANQELKNSMFQDVFGYDSKGLQKSRMNEGSSLPITTINTAYTSQLPIQAQIGGFMYEDHSNLPAVILDQIPLKMRASAEQEGARVIMETKVIQNLIYSYFNIVKKNISDLVPKTIMAFLVNESRKIAQSELVAEIYKAGDLEALLVEDPMVVETRN